MNTPKINAGTITRTVLLVLALVNQALTIFGYSPIPVEDASVEQFISLAFTIGAAVWAWWKDNDITKAARERKAKIIE